jgi:assimilatory nitrate reductase catalytic subunit
MTNLIAREGSVKTICCYCGVGCGVEARVENNAIVSVKGDELHPANYGRLCVKGSSLHETQDMEGRLLQPMVQGEASDWETALNLSAEKFTSIIREHGPDAVAFYLSGQLLTEDYYVANKLMKGFIGTANVDTNSRLCMASAVVAHKRAFGGDIVPGCYEDLERADLVILVGSNTAFAHPITYQRIAKAKNERPQMKVVVIDPRRTATCDIADVHLAIRPGSDAFVFNGLLAYLNNQDAFDKTFIEQHCEGFEQALEVAKTQVSTPKSAAKVCDVKADDLLEFYRLFATTEKVVTVFSQGINQSSSGVDKGNAIINCHLATGKIGKPGSTPFSITGQPNAMGGREVGGLANQLAAHMGYGDPADIDRVARFWQADNMAQSEGLKAVDLFKAIHDGRIKAVWIMATNPVVTMPHANFVREALVKCEWVMVSDCNGNTDTAALADVVLPATTWGEKTGTVTNSERRISLQKGFLAAPGVAKNDWQIITLFAQKMGFGHGFPYTHPVEIFREHAALSGFENHGERAFDISSLEHITQNDYENLTPIQWPITSRFPQGRTRFFDDAVFFTPSAKAQFIPISARFPKMPPKDDQVIMNTGRIRDQWHTMTRTGSAPKLLGHMDEPRIDIHPEDAKAFGVADGELAILSNLHARYLGRINVTNDQRRKEVFVPMHWSSPYASCSRADALVNDITDPLCGQPEFKHTPVCIEPYQPQWSGMLLCIDNIQPDCDYWIKIPLAKGFKYRLADQSRPQNWMQWLNKAFPAVDDWVRLDDSQRRFGRYAGFIGNRLAAVLHISPGNIRPLENRWIEQQLAADCDVATRLAVLAGKPSEAVEDEGAIICSCFQVGRNMIEKFIISDGIATAAELGERLKCGTNCGSCIPELNSLIRECSAKGLKRAH